MTADAAERSALSRRWERTTEWPLMVAAVIFLAAYVVPVLDPALPSWLLAMCRWLSWITWGIFIVDLAIRLALADDRLRYLGRQLVRRPGYCLASAASPAPDRSYRQHCDLHQHPAGAAGGTTESRETVGGASCSRELSPAGARPR
jgi:hypothetical protein